nr:hypothetical protein [Methanobrevibacter arboriphilus]
MDIVIDKDEELPMVPPGCGITDIIGEYKIENDITGISGGLSDTNDVIANKKDGD